MPVRSSREYRDIIINAAEQDADSYKVTGYASTFNNPYELFRDDNHIFMERVDPHAFDGTDMSDVIMQYNHEGRVFARTSNGTLRVMPDETGLLINADLGGTEIGRQLFEEIRGGYTSKMSFGFTVTGQAWEETQNDNGTVTEMRTITQVGKLYDVSAVSIPANDATSLSVRSLCDGVIAQLEAERLKALKNEEMRRRLELKIRIMEAMKK